MSSLFQKDSQPQPRELALSLLVKKLAAETGYGQKVRAAAEVLCELTDPISLRLVLVSGKQRSEERLGDRALLQHLEDGLGGGVSRKLSKGKAFHSEDYSLASTEGTQTVSVYAWPLGQGLCWLITAAPLAPAVREELQGLMDLLSYLSPLWEAQDRHTTLGMGEQTLKERQVDFATHVSHELRTPLTNLVGYLKAMRKEVGGSAEELLGVASDEAGKLQRLVEGFQEFLRTDKKEHRVRTETFDAAEAMRGLSEVHQQFSAPDRPLSFALPDTCRVMFDLEILQAVTSEVLDNARKYGQGLTEVMLSVESQHGLARLSVIDQGPGVPEAEMPFIFDRFFKAKRPDAYNAGGAGLGLFVARERARSAGGDMVAENTEHGLRISLLMPLAE